MPGAVDMRLKRAAFIGYFPDLRQRKHLEATAVCQDRLVPGLELVQPASLPESVQAWTQVEMIGVA